MPINFFCDRSINEAKDSVARHTGAPFAHYELGSIKNKSVNDHLLDFFFFAFRTVAIHKHNIRYEHAGSTRNVSQKAKHHVVALRNGVFSIIYPRVVIVIYDYTCGKLSDFVEFWCEQSTTSLTHLRISVTADHVSSPSFSTVKST